MEGVYNDPKKLDISGEGDRNSYDIIYGRSHQGPAGEGRLQNYIAFFSPKKIPLLRPYRKNLSCKKFIRGSFGKEILLIKSIL